ncbi:uncharacterized protein HMPREF1541_08824 [Cyphellophora europaea CBS 101466]|uniref:Uncharacterized protein n=1 Tax=Cyphellophora europaea (strain CBS 101466) TaxID=1220924 RepID=W2RJ96_CYPE1|nr:uncharacterized protein HMPREF1541_08824 [Cyphellophora europaea CBS 101466]ETN36546.1 hypothetical protein HMPREF1541_08824 [Cyphellophora europaea CBS 101466]
MNPEERGTPPSQSPQRVPAPFSHDRLAEIVHDPQRGPSLSSNPSDVDNDWVSPFTLPPLPALRRSRDQTGLLKSPEHLRQRGGSGAYYAAAWGSPYASPSPESASKRFRDARRGSDNDITSPPRYVQSQLANTQPRARHSLDLSDSLESRTQALQGESERPNWLSDSDESDRERPPKNQRTPTARTELGSWGPSPDQSPLNSSPSSRQTHQTHESVDTVTPETFNEPQTGRFLRKPAQSKMSQVEGLPADISPDSETQKPLPVVPSHSRQGSVVTSKMEASNSPSRPRMGSISSFQKQRKKVLWKGRNCIISLPMTDRESSGLPPVLSPQQVKERLQALRSEGYSTDGFELTDTDGSSATLSNGQSRPTYPDPTEMHAERQMRSYKVYIPDQSEWQKWVEYLQEEKLRALGVTPSNSEPAQSGPSPLSASLSRNSSRFPGPISPPIGTSSAASNSVRVTSNPFSPAFSASSGRGSAIGSGNSSQLNGFPGPMHGYKGSVAFPLGQGRITSPVDFVPGQSPYIPNARSPAAGLNRQPTNFSPVNPHGIQSLDKVVLSPLNGPSNNPQQSVPSNSQSYFPVQPTGLAHKVQGQTPSSLSPPISSQQSISLPRTPNIEQLSRPPIEIQHPTPRSHRHNLSAAFQKEIDDAEAALEREDMEYEARDRSGAVDQDAKEPIQPEDESHEELPILKRPETMGGADDRSEIETNPSIAGTPMLLDDKNPFNKWQVLSDAARGDRLEPTKTHKAQTSLSRFNVEAKEFNPTGGFRSSNFNFSANTGITPFAAPFQPSAHPFQPAPPKPAAPVVRPTHASKPSFSRLNVGAPAFVPGSISAEAPAFVPGASVKLPEKAAEKSAPPEPTPFNFSSVTFNVEAPAFNPDVPSSEVFKSFFSSSTGPTQDSKTSIFGDIKIEPGTQATRRNKALPIVRPRSKDGPAGSASPAAAEHSSAEESEGEDGRAMPPTDRAKRARKVGSDGDRSPVYAESAPFNNNSQILKEIVNDAAVRGVTPEKLDEKPTDGWSYIAADPESIAPRAITPAQKLRSPRMGSPFMFENESDAVKFSESHPSPHGSAERDALLEDLASSPLSDILRSPEPARDTSHKPRFSLSALAEPFEFKPSRPGDVEALPTSSAPESAGEASKDSSQQAPQPAPKPKGKGLMASRFASMPSSSPPSSPPPAIQEPSSPPPTSDLPVPEPATDDIAKDVELSEPLDETATSDLGEPAGTIEASSTVQSPQSAKHQQESSYPSSTVAPELHDRVASLASSRYAPRNDHNLSLSSSRYAPQNDSSSAMASPAYIPGRKELPRVEFSDEGDDLMPSFEEIDAVMKQFETNPELGIERHDSPVQSTPLVDMRLGNNFRSDAPSPSPRRLDRHPDPNNEAAQAASFGLGLGIHRLTAAKDDVSDWNDAISSTEEAKLNSRAQFFDGHVNDLVDGVLENRLGPLERTLQAIQHSVALMAVRPASKQKSISSDLKQSDADDEDEYNAFEGYSAYRSRSPDAKRDRRTSRIRAAVAEGIAQYKESMPAAVAPPTDLAELRAELADMRELVQHSSSNAQLQAELAEMRTLLEKGVGSAGQKDLKATLEHVISSHPRLRGSRVQQDHDSSTTNVKLQLDGLEAMLKVEQERAEHEARLRKQKEDEVLELRRKLQLAEDEAAEQREASDQAEQNLKAFVHEKEAYLASQQQVEKLNMIIDEQEENLNEYRRYKKDHQEDLDRVRQSNRTLIEDLEASRTKTRELALTIEDERLRIKDLTDDLEDEQIKNKDLTRTLWDVRDQLEERTKASRALHVKTDALRTEVTNAVRELGKEQADWRQREHELLTKMTIIEGALDSATRRQEKAEVDHDYVAKQLKDALVYKDRFEHLQSDMAKSQEAMAALRAERIKHEDNAYRLDRELAHVKESKAADIATATARLQAEAEGARSQLEGLRSDSEARITRLQARLDTAEIDIEDHKAKYDSAITEAEETRKQALQEQAEKHEAVLEEQRSSHDRHLADLRERHTRAMHNSSDDKHRLEHQFNERLAFSDDKVKHLEGKVSDLEERLEVTRSAARAAVEAATGKTVNNLPTPANSVVASPPQRAQSASLSLVKGTEIPEKIPVQSLRESIMVLQDQLQNREQQIEKLEAEIAAVDKEAPNKLKAHETENTWLRELLGVRIDDIEDIIQTLSKPDYNREAVKDAAIRLKTNIQMEQQIRERAASNAGAAPALPSLSSLASYAQSPRAALPMAAAAAWGNFRKARDVSMNTLGQIANDYANTPSKAGRGRAVSPAGSWSSGIMTPPNTIQQPGRTPSADASSMPPPAMRPLAAAAAARKVATPTPTPASASHEARPLRAFSSQPRALRTKLESVDGRDPLADAGEGSSLRSPSPESPTAIKGRQNIDLGDDVDEDASPLDERGELKPFDDLPPTPHEIEAEAERENAE